jgi:hypothetical protein
MTGMHEREREKCRYALFVGALEGMSVGNLEWAKGKALRAAYELLAARPEAEARLLTLLVNKLGDPARKVASNAGFLLSCLLTRHPLMAPVIVREVEAFLFRCVDRPCAPAARACMHAPHALHALCVERPPRRSNRTQLQAGEDPQLSVPSET